MSENTSFSVLNFLPPCALLLCACCNTVKESSLQTGLDQVFPWCACGQNQLKCPKTSDLSPHLLAVTCLSFSAEPVCRMIRNGVAIVLQRMRETTLSIMKQALTVLQIFAISQFGCGGKDFQKNLLKRTSKGNHWG